MQSLPPDGEAHRLSIRPVMTKMAETKFIQDELRKNLGNTNRKAKPIRNVYIIENAKKPGVLRRSRLFIESPGKRRIKKCSISRKSRSFSVYQGILRHFSKEEELVEED